MDLFLKDCVVVVTGGTSGIGLESVKLLLKDGAKVAFCGRNDDRLASALDALKSIFNEDQFLGQTCDVLDQGKVEIFAERVKARFGGVNALMNNAGGGRVSTFEDTSDEAWETELNLKFFSVIHPVRAFLPMLKNADNASITITNSLLAKQPEKHMVCTSAARAGQLNLSRSLATEFAPFGIRVNSILIGTVASGQWEKRYIERAPKGQSYEDFLSDLAVKKGIPLGRFGETKEAARVLTFLASPAASFVSGTSIDVSGGVARHI